MQRANSVIEDILAHFGERRGFFQQDRTPVHRAKTTLKMLEAQSLIQLILDWPPNSSGLEK
jgi:hypothetical protein